MHEPSKRLVERYYQAFNAQDIDALLELLSEEVIFDVNRGQREAGKTAFGQCMRQHNSLWQEHIFDIEVMTNDDGSRAAAEFTVLGVYTGADGGNGGNGPRDDIDPDPSYTYRLPGGAFFELEDGCIVRVSASYNPHTLLAQQMDRIMRNVA